MRNRRILKDFIEKSFSKSGFNGYFNISLLINIIEYISRQILYSLVFFVLPIYFLHNFQCKF